MRADTITTAQYGITLPYCTEINTYLSGRQSADREPTAIRFFSYVCTYIMREKWNLYLDFRRSGSMTEWLFQAGLPLPITVPVQYPQLSAVLFF